MKAPARGPSSFRGRTLPRSARADYRRTPMRRVLIGLVLGLVLAAALPAVAGAVLTVSIANRTLTIVGSTGGDDITVGSEGSNTLGPTTDVTGAGQDMQAGTGCRDSVIQRAGERQQRLLPDERFRSHPGDARPGRRRVLDGRPQLPGDGRRRRASTRSRPAAARTPSPADPATTWWTSIATPSGTTTFIDGGLDDDEIRVGVDGRADDVTGGLGQDTVTYAFASSGRTVTLDDQPNDGGGGEGDNIAGDIDTVIGSGSGDTLIGNVLGQTLDGAGGTDRLEGLGGPDILIGGPGTNDATFGGPGEDDIRLRDGLVNACPDGGPDADVFDLDLVDQRLTLGNGLTVLRCIFPRVNINAALLDRIVIGAVREEPNVQLAVSPPAVRSAGARVLVTCPAAMRRRCAGTLQVFAVRGTRALGRVAFTVAPGRTRPVVVPLAPSARAAALRSRALRIVAVKRGRLGAKTSILVARPRR